MTTANDTIQEIFLVAVRNAHALEKEALQIMGRQVERLSNYPEMEMVLRKHIDETKQQEQRIDEILDALGSERSLLKDLATSIVGNMAAMMHAPAGDEVIKNTLANFAFEHYEMAAYKSLLTLADVTGHSAAQSALKQSLAEEEAMARWIDERIADTTRKFLSRSEAGQVAGV